MNRKYPIEKILKDLYLIDPELKNYEKDLLEIINKILSSRPNTKFDEKFARSLKKEIMGEIKKMERRKKENAWQFFNFNFMKKFSYAPAGIIILLLLIIPAAYYLTKKNINLAYDTLKITRVEEKAFGSLQSESPAGDEPALAETAKGLGGGGGGAPVGEASAQDTAVGLPAPGWVNYNYIYKGDDLVITETAMEVLKKVKDSSSSKEFAKYISKLNLGSIDLGKFKNTTINNLDITEDREFGYSLYLNLVENSMSINTNWNKWPRPEAECRDEKCLEQYRLKIEDMPADEEIITIADDFIKEYDIDMKNYGPGQVWDYWRQNYEIAPDKSLAYIPETVPVIYPLIINGQIIYDESGNKTGLTVEVNIRHKKAAGIRDITSRNYISSNYEIENSSEKIIAIAKKGGLRQTFKYPEATKTIDIELGTPTLGLIKYYQYNRDKMESSELLVPAYIFPITDIPEETYFYQENIVVPLVKEIIAERESSNNLIGIPETKQ